MPSPKTLNARVEKIEKQVTPNDEIMIVLAPFADPSRATEYVPAPEPEPEPPDPVPEMRLAPVPQSDVEGLPQATCEGCGGRVRVYNDGPLCWTCMRAPGGRVSQVKAMPGREDRVGPWANAQC